MLRRSHSDHDYGQRDPDERSELAVGPEDGRRPGGAPAAGVTTALREIAHAGSRRAVNEIASFLGATGFTIIHVAGPGGLGTDVVDSTLDDTSVRHLLQAARDADGALARHAADSLLPFCWTFDGDHGLAGRSFEVLFRRSSVEGDVYCFMEAGEAPEGTQLDRLLMAQGLIQPVFERHLREGTPEEADDNRITSRERECLRWCAEGKTSEEIAIILSLSTHTVNNYLISATRKLHAVNRMHAIANAFRKGVLPLNPRAAP